MARAWQTKKQPVDVFSNFWCGFNKLFYLNENRSEREKIKSYLEQNTSEENASKILNTHEPQVSILISSPVKNMCGNGRNTK